MNNNIQSDMTAAISDSEFLEFQRITLKLTGIQLADTKRGMLTNRLAKRMASLELQSYHDYIYLLNMEGNRERNEFINAVTTNLTYFYREPHHFKFFTNTVLPKLSEQKKVSEPIRIWSAGCSYGQEPYSLAIESCKSEITSDIRILCTDIDSDTVDVVHRGIYSKDHMRGLSDEAIRNWFIQRTNKSWQAVPQIRNLLICKQLNLFSENWPINPSIDVIMCRNVLIYFNISDQQKLIRRFSDYQDPGGYLFLGHSESIKGIDNYYKRVGNTVFQRY